MDDEQEDARVKKGIYLAELIWWSLAKRIVRIASEHYKWDDDHLRQISDIFLRPNDYKVNVI
jgi:hypothetical protein